MDVGPLTQEQCGELRRLVKPEMKPREPELKKAIIGTNRYLVMCPHCAQVNRSTPGFGPGNATCIHCGASFHVVVKINATSIFVHSEVSTWGTIACPYCGTKANGRKGQHKFYCGVCTQDFFAEAAKPAPAPLPSALPLRSTGSSGMGK